MDKVAIYCRLSKEDQDKLEKGDDSGSIQNQKMILLNVFTFTKKMKGVKS